MSYTLNDKIKNLVPYEPISGTFNIRLDANECTLNYNDEFKQLVFDAVNSIEFNRYPDPTCINIRKSFADFYGIDYKNVTVGNGSDELLFIIESAFLEKGDSLLVATPDFSMYEFYSSIAEVNCVKYVKNTELNIDVDKLIDTVNSNNIGLVLFSNPCNPTGQGVCKKDIVKLLNSVNALVVLDEAYMDFWSDEESLIKDVNNYSNLIVLRTASKAMGSAALRLGFAVSNITITNALTAVKSPYNVNTLSQTIGASVYKNKKFLKNQINTIVENTNLLYNKLVDISNNTEDFVVYPTKTNFVFIKTSFGKDLWNFLKDNSVAIRFMGDYIRITAGTKEEIDTTVKLIDRFISER
ncbi:MAG: aminotransferase class I/II-fold pyridoxal phosphate-dependent enzyme [Oscillospiraceae bacterium]|nr:aminotransferase class I/II-fold pyridoxal phosphate-dependent enzyme [Oscillospiraceae bacterium]